MPAATRLLFLTGWGVATGLLFWTALAKLFGLSEEARRLGRVFDLVRPTGFFLTGCSDDLGFSNRPRLSANIDLNADCNIKGMQHSQLFLVDIPPELMWVSLFLLTDMVQAILLPWNMSTLKSDKCSQTWNVYFGVLVTCGLIDVGTVLPNFGLLSTSDAFRLIWLPLKDFVAFATLWFVVCLVILATWAGGDVVGGVNLTRTKQKTLSWTDCLNYKSSFA